MDLYAWIPKQGWLPVVDVIDYYNRVDDLGSTPVADVVLFDGSVFRATLEYNLFTNLQDM